MSILLCSFAITSHTEFRSNLPVERYGWEALLITCSSILFLIVPEKIPISTNMRIIIVHITILIIACMRNSMFIKNKIQEPINVGSYIEIKYTLIARKEKGLKALWAAIMLPSGILGIVFIISEIAFALIDLQKVLLL